MQRLSSPSFFCGVRAAQSLVFCEMLCPFVLFLLAIVLSVSIISKNVNINAGIFFPWSYQIFSTTPFNQNTLHILKKV
jgi:hypothetical protein